METKMWRELLIPYQQAVQEMQVKFESIANENHRLGQYSPIEYVTVRVKKISSILEKAKKKSIKLNELEDDIEDIAGVRIICQFVEDIEKVVELIKSRKDMTIKYEKDYIVNSKSSGYKSYHMIVYYDVHTALGEKRIQAEIQIRTLAMNFWATIEHSLNYKYKHNIPDNIRMRLVAAANAAHNLDKEMSTIRSEVMDAQDSFQFKSSIIADILNNIQNISKVSNDDEEVTKIQDEFYLLWEQGDIDTLVDFNVRLDAVAENYKAQSLHL